MKEHKEQIEEKANHDDIWERISTSIDGVELTKNGINKAWYILVFLAAFGILFGLVWQANKVDELEQQMAQWQQTMDSKATGAKIKFVQNLDHDKRDEEALIKVLVNSFQKESSVPVRMACLEKLKPFTHREDVRLALIESLDLDQNPRLLLSTLGIIKEYNIRGANEPMENISNNHRSPVVRGEAKEVMDKLIEL